MILSLALTLTLSAMNPEDYGYKCFYKNIHGNKFRQCGQIIKPKYQWRCQQMYFVDHMKHKHKYKICYLFPADVEIKSS